MKHPLKQLPVQIPDILAFFQFFMRSVLNKQVDEVFNYKITTPTITKYLTILTRNRLLEFLCSKTWCNHQEDSVQ